MKSELILHIGAGKCGSSSLQSYFSKNSAHTSLDGRRYEYVALGRNKLPIRGEDIQKQAEKNPFSYVNYPPLGQSGENLSIFRRSTDVLRDMRKEGITPILSCEGWIKESEKFTEHRVLEKIGIETDVVIYIRPPLDWLNSAYWQWGAWTDAPFERWFMNSHSDVFWNLFAERWSNVPNVKSVTLRLATGDIVTDFMKLINCPLKGANRNSNSGSSGDFLRFLQRNRVFRPDPHSPLVEFIFNKSVTERSSPTPWVINEKFQDLIFKRLGDRYKSLEKYFSKDDWEKIKNDDRWWNNNAYRDRIVETPDIVNDIEGADRLISQLIHNIMERFPGA